MVSPKVFRLVDPLNDPLCDEQVLEHLADGGPTLVDPDPEGFFACLQVRRDATQAEIRQAYHRATQIYHPDKLFGATPRTWKTATEHMQKLNLAFFTLSDPQRRLAYTHFGTKGAELLEVVPRRRKSGEEHTEPSLLKALHAQLQQQLVQKLNSEVASTGYLELRLDFRRALEPLLAPPPLSSSSDSSTDSATATTRSNGSADQNCNSGSGERGVPVAEENDNGEGWPVVLTRTQTYVIKPAVEAAIFPANLQPQEFFVAFRPPLPAQEIRGRVDEYLSQQPEQPSQNPRVRLLRSSSPASTIKMISRITVQQSFQTVVGAHD
eukprot:RCo016448